MDAKKGEAKPVKIKAEKVRELKLPSAVMGLARSPDAKLLYAACLDGAIYEVAAESGEL